MSKQTGFILLLSFLIIQTLADSPCGDWLSYGDDNCLKVIDSLNTETEAGSICRKQLGGTLAVIRSAEEQDLVYNYLKNISFSDNVWIGFKKDNNSFKAIDGSVSNYSNWNTGRPTNQPGFNCVEMSVDYQGKWSDVKCEKKNAVLCEKNQEWSNNKIKIILQEFRKNYADKITAFENRFEIQKKEIQSQKNEIDHLKDLKQNSVPIGFIYIQLFGQSEPHTLWPNTQWDNISQNYSGSFFRAEGGGSNKFGQIQEQQTQTIEFQDDRCGNFCKTTITNDGNFIGNSSKITKQYPSTAIFTGRDSHGDLGIGIKFKQNSEEIRPQNQAIRIWIRIK